MDFKKIEKEYPKAWKLLKAWFGYKKDTTVNMELSTIFMPERKLYDFFDEQEIYVQISVKCAMDDSIWYLPYVWGGKFDIHLRDEKTRTEAEKAAFLKAFEILNLRI